MLEKRSLFHLSAVPQKDLENTRPPIAWAWMARFEIAEAQHARLLERQWAAHCDKNQLDLYGKFVVSEFRGNDCVHSTVR